LVIFFRATAVPTIQTVNHYATFENVIAVISVDGIFTGVSSEVVGVRPP